MTYTVKEIYFTLQGEGAQTGRAAVFLQRERVGGATWMVVAKQLADGKQVSLDSQAIQGVVPRLSVVLPCRDAARWLPVAIRSLDRQTFRDFDVIAIDGVHLTHYEAAF